MKMIAKITCFGIECCHTFVGYISRFPKKHLIGGMVNS